MKVCANVILSFWLFLSVGTCCNAQDQAIKTTLDANANPKVFDTLFCRYGCEPLKHLGRRREWVQIKMPAKVDEKPATQAGLYSYFSLSGDFTIEVHYHCGTIPAPKKGYGMSCGIAVDTHGPDGAISFTRNFSHEKNGSGYAVTRSIPVDNKPEYETKIFPTKARKGRLIFKRVGKVVYCLAGDNKEEPTELCKLEFTESKVYQLRLFADPGGADYPINMWIGKLQINADSISTAFPGNRQVTYWWLIPIGLFVLVLVGFLYRKKKLSQKR